jgi:ABC-type dipeptide/oligopeptide/nickel transport system permease subunit
MRWAVWITLPLVILLAVYIASPLIALHSIASAVQTKDAVALTERIEFPAVRRSLTKQLVANYRRLTGKTVPLGALGRRLVVSVADPVVARLMTVRALLDLLGKGEAGEGGKVRIERAPITPNAFKSVWRLWLNSDYLGRDFYVRLPPEGPRDDRFTLHLRLINWRWKVVGIDLPEELKERLAQEIIKLTQERLAPLRR